MTCAILLVFLFVLHVSKSNWISDWMTPVHEHIASEENPEKFRRSGIGGILKTYETEYQKTIPIIGSREFPLETHVFRGQEHTGNLKLKLETTLENAKLLAEALLGQIAAMTLKEKMLKEIITQGRHGVSMLTVACTGQLPRKYIIREGVWTLCTGILQPPVTTTDSFDIYSASARCIGNEMITKPDPCVFNSVIKYETIPTRRRLQYIEDDYLCLRPTFNVTLEKYMSVPKRLINETCTNGMIRSLDDNMIECGLRVLSDYSYYPNKGSSSDDLPLEYCVEEDGACKLLVAWHVSNSTVENFEFLKDEPSFKNYFMKNSNFV